MRLGWINHKESAGCPGALYYFFNIIDYFAAKEGGAVFQGRLINDDRSALCFDTLHDALDGGLAEVVGIGFHGEAVHANHDFLLLGFFDRGIAFTVSVRAGDFQHFVRDIIFPGTIALYNIGGGGDDDEIRVFVG